MAPTSLGGGTLEMSRSRLDPTCRQRGAVRLPTTKERIDFDAMHERNDETLQRPAHGRAAFGTHHSTLGLERYVAEFGTPPRRYRVAFEGRNGPKAAISHSDPFFRALENAWNERPDFAQKDVHARFWGLTEPGVRGGFSFEERVTLVSSFLTTAAAALEVLASGQHPEVDSLEEHAQHLRLQGTSPRNEVL